MSARVPVPGDGPAAMLTDTIGRVAVAESRLSQLGADLSELGAVQADTHTLVRELQRQVSALADAVAALGGAAEDEGEDEDAAVVDWSRLPRAEAERAWQRLYEWLDSWFVPTYRVTVTQLRPCWPHHPDVREELSWLRSCWAAAYRSSSAAPTAAAEWHTRWLPGALDRIAGHYRRTGCTMGQHLGQPLPDEIRAADDYELSRMRWWLHDGLHADLAARAA